MPEQTYDHIPSQAQIMLNRVIDTANRCLDIAKEYDVDGYRAFAQALVDRVIEILVEADVYYHDKSINPFILLKGLHFKVKRLQYETSSIHLIT